MYAKTIKYTDYSGNEREETFYFNLSKAELIDLEWRTPGGLEGYMKHIMSLKDGQALADTFKMLIEKSYGVKSLDGRKFIKTQAVLEEFKFTEAYSELYMMLATDDKIAADFVNGIFPHEAVEEAKRIKEAEEKSGIRPVETAPAPAPAPVIPMVEGQQVMASNVYQAPSQPEIPTVEGQVVYPQGFIPSTPLQ